MVAVVLFFLVSGLSVVGLAGSVNSPGRTAHNALPASNVRVPAAASPSLPLPDASPIVSVGSPHPGVLNAYELNPSGATTLDPAIAYDTGSYEPILNVYQTLVNFNGSSTTTFVPTLATCVPGTVQCVNDYGTNLTTYNSTGSPIAWTFVIDPAARFYDPQSHASWGVFPSDVMFSVARSLAFANLPYPAKNPGWILGQSLLPTPTAKGAVWDGGIHAGVPGYDLNNTPGNILGSMLVNDSFYCPSSALSDAHGCVTFVAHGGGADWPFFLQLVADNLGASIVPCGWFTSAGAGIPGWAGTNASSPGDGPCKLPNGGTSTSTPSWAGYVATLNSTTPGARNATYWDAFEKLAETSPNVQPGVQWAMVGSGPYSAEVFRGTGYVLSSNPAYVQPSGCSGAGGLAVYGGYCDPAVGAYLPKVNVYWSGSIHTGIAAMTSGAADILEYYPNCAPLLHCYFIKPVQYIEVPTADVTFLPFSLEWSAAAYGQDGFPGSPNIPSDFLSGVAVRQFLSHAFPYATVEQNLWTSNGFPYRTATGGPIPKGFDNYPTNVSFPNGNPDTNPSDVGGAAWWWAQGVDPSSSEYDPELASCTGSTPCTFAIFLVAHDSTDSAAVGYWISELEALSGGALLPYTVIPSGIPSFEPPCDLGPSCLPDSNPAPIWLSGWGPDYPAPADYLTPMSLPDQFYTSPDAVAEQLSLPAFDDVGACGHSAVSFADLVYWATAGPLNDSCQGVAYSIATGWSSVADRSGPVLPYGPKVNLTYNLVEHILNELGLYVWDGESQSGVTAASWIASSTINKNPMIGGGDDQVWFQIRYTPPESPVTFKAVGLPTNSTWSVTSGLGTSAQFNRTVGHVGKILFEESNGTMGFSISAPAGFGVSKVAGPRHPSQTSAEIQGAETLTVTFGPLEGLYVNETGLPSGSLWSVSITSSIAHGGPPAQSATSHGASIAFTVVKGTWKFQVTITPSGYRAVPPRGSITVRAHPTTRRINFKPIPPPRGAPLSASLYVGNSRPSLQAVRRGIGGSLALEGIRLAGHGSMSPRTPWGRSRSALAGDSAGTTAREGSAPIAAVKG